MFAFSQKDVHAHDASRSLSRPASRIAMLDCVQRNFGEDLIPRELRAFCHLCSLDAPAVTELCKLSKDDLVQWGKKCSEAADEWCSFSWDSEASTEEVSNPTEISTQVRSFIPQPLYSSSKKTRATEKSPQRLNHETYAASSPSNQSLSVVPLASFL